MRLHKYKEMLSSCFLLKKYRETVIWVFSPEINWKEWFESHFPKNGMQNDEMNMKTVSLQNYFLNLPYYLL
jgi:hypothetical protein